MVATEIVNGTEDDLSLKEGNAGVYREIKTLKPNQKHTIEIDPNATYREYVVVKAPGGDKVFVTSDDCIDNATITIVVKDNKYVFKGVIRGDPKAAADPAQGGFFAKILKKVFGRK